jgi:hypothetical protein
MSESRESNTNVAEDRSHDQKIVLKCPASNIPSVAFCNTGEDLTGRWLLATNVLGDVLLWDVHKQELVRTINAGYKTDYPPNQAIEHEGYDPRYSGKPNSAFWDRLLICTLYDKAGVLLGSTQELFGKQEALKLRLVAGHLCLLQKSGGTLAPVVTRSLMHRHSLAENPNGWTRLETLINIRTRTQSWDF